MTMAHSGIYGRLLFGKIRGAISGKRKATADNRLAPPSTRTLALLGLVAVVLFVGSSGARVEKLVADARGKTIGVKHTYEVREKLDALLFEVASVAAEQRGYLLTHDRTALAAYMAAVGSLRADADQLPQMVADNATQVARAGEFARLIGARLKELNASVNQAPFGDAAGPDGATRGRDMDLMTGIGAKLQVMKQEESNLLAARERISDESARFLLLLTLGAVALAGVALAWAARSFLREQSTRIMAALILRQSGERYRLLTDASSDMVSRIDIDGRQQYVSPACLDILGFDPAELLNTRPSDLMHPDDAPRITSVIDGLINGRDIQARGTYRVRHKLGHWVWVEVQYRLTRDKMPDTPSEVVATLRDVTERHLLQQRLSETNRRLLMAEQLAHVGNWWLCRQTDTFTWSDEVYRIHGLDANTFCPSLQRAVELYHPDDQSAAEQVMSGALATSDTLSLRIIRPDGEIGHVSVRCICDIDELTGESRGVSGSIMDVTELARVERHLTEKSALLETTLNNMDQALIKVASDGTIELVNRRFAQLLGLPPELLGQPRQQFADVLAHLATAGRYGKPDSDAEVKPPPRQALLALGTYEHCRPDGTVLEVRSVPGGNGAVVSTYADITLRRRSELEVEESHARYRILAETTSDVITQLDLNFQRLYVSPACKTVLGYEPEEMVGTPTSASLHPEDEPEQRLLCQRLCAGLVDGDRAVTTYRVMHKLGHWVWLEGSMSLVRNNQTGAPSSLICSLRDVTLRQRTALHLERAKVAAEQAAQSKAEFLANMSHELRTPLTGMLGVHDLLKADKSLTGEQRRLVQLASESGHSLLGIVNDVLDLSKFESGHFVTEQVPFDVRLLVESCRSLAEETLNGKPVRIETKIMLPDPGVLLGDPARLRQILHNLIGNAVKFTDAGVITIVLTYACEAAILRVEVVDTGIGIATGKLPMLFDRFSQADSSTTRRYGGTGLGLSICKRLVELMNGRIGVESLTGQGSRFWFELPRWLQSSLEPPTLVPESGAVPQATWRILLAEDNETNQEIIKAVLGRNGHVVVAVADGAGAVAAVRADRGFDVVLMDLQMPGMDGLAATIAIRRMERSESRPRLPIIGLTANAMAEDIGRCLRAGMDGHVAKPVEWDTLFGAISKAIASPAGPPQIPSDDGFRNEAALRGLEDIIGRDRLGKILENFAAQVGNHLAGSDPATPRELENLTHSLGAVAGQLGFSELSQLCADLEDEARGGGGLDRLPEFRLTAERAVVAARSSSMAQAA